MTVVDPDLGVLPKPGLLIGGEHIAESTGGQFQHVYAATGKPTVAVSLAGAHEIDLAVCAVMAWSRSTHHASKSSRRRAVAW